MYKIEYQQDNGLVTSITDATETPVTLQEEGVAYYKGEIPEDREGFTKELYWGVDPNTNINPRIRSIQTPTLYATYTVIEGWIELANAEDVARLDDKASQLEQDLNFVRGDVKGVNGMLLLDDTFSINQTWHIITDSKSTNPSDFKGIITQYTDKGLVFRRSSIGVEFVGYGIDPIPVITIPINESVKTIDLIICIDNFGLMTFYANGVKSTTIDVSLLLNRTEKLKINGWNDNRQVGDCIRYIRKFNTALTQEQVDLLYNQGRCDEVVIGDEWRQKGFAEDVNYKEISNVTSLNKFVPYNNVDPWSNFPRNVFNITHRLVSKTDTVGSYRILAFNPDGSKFSVLAEVPMTNNVGDDHVVSVVIDSMYSKIGIDRVGGNVSSIVDMRVNVVNILNEYLPAYLTKTKWIDNGVSKQDIALTAPTFTYIRPYKQHLFGSGAPSIIPDAAFTEYSDTATGNIWKCGTKPNTRQFAVSDWKQINN